ncbi:MAG: hypothetical protein OXC93_13240 [Rhodospirillaceae bacterium]|nr:hypothetical protein [Rhodospirillaceae bacterium]
MIGFFPEESNCLLLGRFIFVVDRVQQLFVICHPERVAPLFPTRFLKKSLEHRVHANRRIKRFPLFRFSRDTLLSASFNAHKINNMQNFFPQSRFVNFSTCAAS